MSLSNFHKIPEIQKLLKRLEAEAEEWHLYDEQFAKGIEYCIKRIRKIIDST